MRQPTCTPEELAEAMDGALVALKRAAKVMEANGCPGSAMAYSECADRLALQVYGPASRPDITV